MNKSLSYLLIILVTSLAVNLTAYAKNNYKPKKHKSLPPGLQKKEQQGKPLPPGWQKKLQKGHILDIDIYHHAKIVVPVDKRGLITVSIDGRLLKLDKVTRKIIDILN